MIFFNSVSENGSLKKSRESKSAFILSSSEITFLHVMHVDLWYTFNSFLVPEMD
jgi:hypothetical protein